MSDRPPFGSPVGYAGPRGTFGPRDGYQVMAQYEPRLALDLVVLPPILPAPTRDFRTLDFATLINLPGVAIEEAYWECHVMPDTPVDDFSPGDRLIGDPLIDEAGQTTTHLVGDMLDGVHYLLVAALTLADGRVLVRRGSLNCVAQPLVGPPLPPGAIAFNYDRWISLFPEFVGVSPQQAGAFWRYACEIVRNDYHSPVRDPQEREDILLLLTAHVAALFGGPMGGGGFGPQITGQINSKSVDGVSLSGGAFGGVNGTQAWYQLTRYGQLAWMKLRAYRLFTYVPGPQRFLTHPWTSWPWLIGGAGWPWFGLRGGRGREGPQGPPGPPGPSRIYTDQKSIIGSGTVPEDPLRVWIIEGDPDFDGGPVKAREVYVDRKSIVGQGTTQDPLRARIIEGGSFNGAPEAGIGHNRGPRLAEDTIARDGSLRGSGTEPDDPLAIDRVEGGSFDGEEENGEEPDE